MFQSGAWFQPMRPRSRPTVMSQHVQVLESMRSRLPVRRRRRDPREELWAARIEKVLGSRTWCEVLGIHPSTNGAETTSEIEDRDVEAGLTRGLPAEDISDGAVLEAFLRVSAGVHPFQNTHPEASLALRWVVEAFAKLRGLRDRAAVGGGTQVFGTPLRDQACATTAEEAQRIFAEVVSSTYDRLSLRNPEDCGLSKIGGDALLRSLHLLHMQPVAQAQRQDWTMMNMLLVLALIANWAAVAMVRMVRIFSSNTERIRSELVASTTVTALGGVLFSGASRIQRVTSSDTTNITRTFGTDPLEALVRCPLCRVATPSSRAIQDVHAGDTMPACCVCTENKADVCLPCGHLCICGECFRHLPRTTAAAA